MKLKDLLDLLHQYDDPDGDVDVIFCTDPQRNLSVDFIEPISPSKWVPWFSLRVYLDQPSKINGRRTYSDFKKERGLA